jgi:hypothetical protein
VWSRIAERRGRRRAQALSRAIAELPPATRRVMLEAAETEELIVGAYTDRRGRMCPILAAHRRGARTHAGAFPRAWDAFGQANRPRPASERELEILKALLQESLGGASVGSVAVRGSGGRVAGAGAEVGGEPQLTPAGGAQAS